MAFGVDYSRNDIYYRHEDRQYINREASYRKHRVFFAKILDESKLHSLKALHS